MVAPVVEPISPEALPPQYPPEAYYGLLTDPPGTYGYVSHGGSKAVTLKGSPEFLRRGETLFSSFGSDSDRGKWVDSRPPVVHPSEQSDAVWFSMTPARVHTALRLYLCSAIIKARLIKTEVLDEDGDFIEYAFAPLDETAIMEEAASLATSFMAHEMRPDYSIIPERYESAMAYALYSCDRAQTPMRDLTDDTDNHRDNHRTQETDRP